MKVSSISINQIFSPCAIKKFASVPSFKSRELSTDVFVKTVKAPEKVSEDDKVKTALPKYLYHLTNQESYQKIVDSGKMKISKDIIDGVFMFDIDDFKTNWKNSKVASDNENLAKSLLEQAIKSGKGLVLLKIPTENLESKKFAIRPQDDVIAFLNSNHFRNLAMAYAESGGIFNNKWLLPKDLVEGYSPTETKTFTDNGRAIEYVYQDDIDLENAGVEKILELPNVDIRTIKNSTEEDLSAIYSAIEQSV